MAGGRPSEYDEAIATDIIDLLAMGTPLKRICAGEGMPSYTTVLRWEENNSEFRVLLARAKRVGTHSLADECLDIADDPNIDTKEKHIRIDTRLRLIGKWHKKAYGERVELVGDEDAPLQTRLSLDGLSEQQRVQLRKLLEATSA